MTAGPEEIAEAVARLRAGGIVAFPTETVYGLGADALDAAAVERVFGLKGRPATNPLIVHVSGEAMAQEVGEWSEDAQRLSAAFWPGPLTILLPRRARVPKIVTAGLETVGVRCPDHPITLALLEAFGGPLVGPSANRSGRVSPTRADHVRAAFSGRDVFVLDGGPCRGGIESTVLMLGEPARVVRPGLVSAEELGIVLGREVVAADVEAAEGEAAVSPGLQGMHYAPEARAVVFEGEAPAGDVVVLAVSSGGFGERRVIRMPSEAGGYAARLYAALREADAMRPEVIAIEAPPREGAVWEAVWDRIRRAAGG
jgi:L-threonylcarbamoyladenylate synthase